MNHCQRIIFYGTLGCIIFCLLFTVSITLYSLAQLLHKNSLTWITKHQRTLTILIMTSFTICNTVQLVLVIDRFFICPEKRPCDIRQIWLQFGKNIFYWIGNILFYVFLLLRITVPFELNKCIFCSLAFAIFISAITAIAYSTMTIIIYDDNYNVWRVMALLLLFTDLAVSGFVLVIFVRKIKNTMSDIDPTTSLKAEQSVQVMTNVVAKHGLLFGIAIAFNPPYLVMITMNTYIGIGGFYSFFTDIGTAITQSIEGAVVVLVLWLILRINYERYICLCKFCHICIARCCFKGVDSERIVDNPYQNLIELNSATSGSEIEIQSTNPSSLH